MTVSPYIYKMLPPPRKFVIALFTGFQALDVFGPLDILNMLSRNESLQLSVLADTLDPIHTNLSPTTIGEAVVPTHTFDNAPQDIEVIIVPGGGGTRSVELSGNVTEYVKRVYPNMRHVLSGGVCTGAHLTAEAGFLDGKRATTNENAWEWVTSRHPNVKWVHQARWVEDGNSWSSSGISAGIDMMYAFIAHTYGNATAADIARLTEYTRELDPNNDPFAVPNNGTWGLAV